MGASLSLRLHDAITEAFPAPEDYTDRMALRDTLDRMRGFWRPNQQVSETTAPAGAEGSS